MLVNGMSGAFANQSFPTDREALIFGRSSSSCNMIFPENTRGVSRMHCRIEQNGPNCTITDLGSSYGTFVNGMKIQAYSPRVLRNGDTFYLGEKANMFSFQNPNDVMSVRGMQAANSVTYLNQRNVGQKNNKALIGVIVAAVLVICIVSGIAIYSVQQAQEEARIAEQELYDEQNKGFVGNLIDTLEDGVDLFW